ncbi:helicase-associated domain-containing protein [Paenibacillus sp. sgz302251]|uniref:helicase-associated domain-containing protein n=1 Tax=Paenibacillus sp. sgz302251 TaxID=3414493 RepID=UPI003C7CF734
MNKQQLLDKLSDEQKERMLQAPAWCDALKQGLSWQEAITDKMSIQAAAERLSSQAALVLKQMLQSFAAVPVDEEKLLTTLHHQTVLSGAECRWGLADLIDAGILFSVRKVWGECIYFMPVECFVIWQNVLFPFTGETISVHDRNRLMKGKIRSNRIPFSKQLLYAFSVLAKSGMELTLKGVLAKKTIAKLSEAADLDEQCLLPFELKWSYKEHYPLKAAFILEAGTACGLIQRVEGQLKWDEARLRRWLLLNSDVREKQLMDWCLGLLMPAGSVSSHTAAALYGIEKGLWYSDHMLNEWSQAASIKLSEGLTGRDPLALSCWLSLFHSLGWMDVIDCDGSDTERLLYRWKSNAVIGAAHNDLSNGSPPFIHVQPNGELIVEPECPYIICWELELLAERISDEQVAVYKIEAATITRALEHGRTLKSIRDFLVHASGGERLPAMVEAMLDLWTGRACRTEFAEVVLLRCDNEQMAELVEKVPEIAAMRLFKLGVSDFIVSKTDVLEIRRLLQQAGYPPRKGIQSSASVEEIRYPMMKAADEAAYSDSLQLLPEDSSRSTVMYIYEHYPLHQYEITENDANTRTKSFYKKDQVPAMWMKQLRSYHHSTRKEMIERALAWQTPVQLRMDDELRSFVPERLEQQEGGWAVIGKLRNKQERELIRLTPDMWEEMRLVLPGQSEQI